MEFHARFVIGYGLDRTSFVTGCVQHVTQVPSTQDRPHVTMVTNDHTTTRRGRNRLAEDPRRLFDWLEECRDQPGWRWSQKRMAEACQVTPNTMRGWRNGSMPDRATLATIAAAVGVPVAALHRIMAGEPVHMPPGPPGHPLVPVEDGGEFSARLRRLEERVETLTDLVLRLQASRGRD
jgi:transcriptional regulator with XRE-family HTH domain